MIELIAGIVLAAGAVYFVLRPILRPESMGTEIGEADGANEGEDPDDDFSSRAVALRALKEIEFDRATGKLSDQDYDALKSKYTSEALAAIRAETEEQGAGSGSLREGTAPRSPLPPSDIAPRSPLPVSTCPAHGPRPESDAQFCAECGRRLGTAPGYCARCGTSLENGARYCHSCGARVAA